MNSRVLLLLATLLLASQASLLRTFQSEKNETNQIADSDNYTIYGYWDISDQFDNFTLEDKGDFVAKVKNNTSANQITINVNYNQTLFVIDEQSNFIGKNSGYFNEIFYYNLSLDELKPLIQKRVTKLNKQQK
ncbi:hypothetical protein TTHERM_00922990 (macronuclear) [Tetrahymena thermophila SB210]|uniref:Transmembrane protein n=1 Tax=Tetrahymena thermophila (strain SB210) TaxID=312017 RepID=Q23WP6_TETTS|nr:hypothetical protein TTHERM_00922990 [Tetrahymena thermophila SB210]EAS00934.1 hypothetical protein TTHERM_00922990 [Tetrahymena thermophila SB210]|eukprot:XP_001021179.1 hypothetical protein TTHERM_00922990 [Tetrahymena thermophila SB210]